MELTALRRALPDYTGVQEDEDLQRLLTVVDEFREDLEALELEVRRSGGIVENAGGIACTFAQKVINAMLMGSDTMQGLLVERVIAYIGIEGMRTELKWAEEREQREATGLGDLDDHPF